MATRNSQSRRGHRRRSDSPAPVVDDFDQARLPRGFSRGYWPVAGAALAFAAGAAAAATLGAPEVMLGLGVAYATYEIMRHRMGLLKALQAAAQMEKLLMGR